MFCREVVVVFAMKTVFTVSVNFYGHRRSPHGYRSPNTTNSFQKESSRSSPDAYLLNLPQGIYCLNYPNLFIYVVS